MVVDGVVSNASEGRVLMYPHARVKGQGTALTPKDYISSELIGTVIPDSDPEETYTAEMVNQVWDEDEANAEYSYHILRLREYDGYVEEQTHIAGKIQLLNRFV
jgi:hypothetical protein